MFLKVFPIYQLQEIFEGIEALNITIDLRIGKGCPPRLVNDFFGDIGKFDNFLFSEIDLHALSPGQ